MVAGLGHVVCGVAGGEGPVPLHTLLRQGVRYTQSICTRDSKSIEHECTERSFDLFFFIPDPFLDTIYQNVGFW